MRSRPCSRTARERRPGAHLRGCRCRPIRAEIDAPRATPRNRGEGLPIRAGTKHATRFLSVLFLTTLLLTGCSPAADADLVATCEGTYDCTGAGTAPVETALARRDGRCYAGELVLAPDGTINASAAGTQLTWRGTAASFAICAGSDCLTCARRGGGGGGASGGDAGGSTGGRCTGYTGVCANRGGACESLPGCYRARVYVGDFYSYYCRGTPERCESRHFRHDCERLTGCSWEP